MIKNGTKRSLERNKVVCPDEGVKVEIIAQDFHGSSFLLARHPLLLRIQWHPLIHTEANTVENKEIM